MNDSVFNESWLLWSHLPFVMHSISYFNNNTTQSTKCWIQRIIINAHEVYITPHQYALPKVNEGWLFNAKLSIL